MADSYKRYACFICGWVRGHDIGCPNDPLNPIRREVLSTAITGAQPEVAKAPR